MSELDEDHSKLEGKMVRYPTGYQRRSKKDLFRSFIIENRKSIRVFKVIFPIAILLAVIWLIARHYISLVIMIPFMVLGIIGILGYIDVWRVLIKNERQQIPRRAFVKERTLYYGDFGIVFKENAKNGQSQEKYAWSRYGHIFEWVNTLYIVPAKKKADTFEIREDEIGKDNFAEFRDFAKSKLSYSLITSFRELV